MSNKNKNFNFENFAVSMVKAIDMLRSKGKTGSKGGTESRINAFYRGIGLPAIVVEPTLHSKDDMEMIGETVIDPLNTANNFFDIDFSTDTALISAMRNRETSGYIPVTDAEIKTFLDNLTESPAGGVNKDDQTGFTVNVRRRGTLFPMYVNGSIHIFPQHKRVGPAFAEEEDLVKDKIKYQRPLIESILSMRLTGEGAANSTNAVTVASVVEQQVVEMAKDIENILQSSTNNVKDLLEFAVRKANAARKFTGKSVKAEPGNVPAANPESKADADKEGQTEWELRRQEKALLKRQAKLSVFEFDDTFGSGESRSRNLKAPVFASFLIDVLVGGPSTSGGTEKVPTSIEKNMKETKERIKKHDKSLKQASKELDLILGTYSGISGTDILAIILALFLVSTDTLTALLNDEAKANLKLAKGVAASTTSVQTAIAELQKKVVEILQAIDTDIKIYKHKDKPSKKPKG